MRPPVRSAGATTGGAALLSRAGRAPKASTPPAVPAAFAAMGAIAPAGTVGACMAPGALMNPTVPPMNADVLQYYLPDGLPNVTAYQRMPGTAAPTPAAPQQQTRLVAGQIAQPAAATWVVPAVLGLGAVGIFWLTVRKPTRR